MDATTPRHEPYDVDLEAAVLGSLLVDNRLIDVVGAHLVAEQFYDPLHQRLFTMILHLRTEGDVTPLILHSVMKRDPGLVEMGGRDYLVTLLQAAPALPNIERLSSLLAELAYRRELIEIGESIISGAYEAPGEKSARGVADEGTEALLRVGRAGAPKVLTAYESALESLHEAEKIATGQPVPLIKTGWAKLDDEIGGLRGGDLVVIPAKSGMGKSALMGGLGLNTARAGVPTLVFSLEMMRRQWVERLVCDLDFDIRDIGVRPLWYSRMRNGRLNSDEFTRFGAAMQLLHGLPLEIRDEDDLTILQVQSIARAFAAKHGTNADGSARLGIVIIDYAQIVDGGDTRDRNREQVVAGIARGAKSLAKRLGWPVVIGSQMNENAGQRAKEESRPQAGDVRESKALMNEADLMLSPYRQAYFVENRRPSDAITGDVAWEKWRDELKACRNRMEVLVLKNRHGRRFEVEMFCDMGASAIRDSAPYQPTPSDQAADDLLAGLAP